MFQARRRDFCRAFGINNRLVRIWYTEVIQLLENNTTCRSLVPYQPPRHSIRKFAKEFVSRSSILIYSVFRKRFSLYIGCIILFSFALLVGAYFSHIHNLILPMRAYLRLIQIILPLCIASSLTVFGVILIPAGYFTSAFCLGLVLRLHLFENARDFICFFMLLAFLFFVTLYFSEAFYTSSLMFHSFMAAVFRKSFVTNIILLLLTLTFYFGTSCFI